MRARSAQPILRSLEFLIPGDVMGATGGYVYDRCLIAALRTLGWQITVHSLAGDYPNADELATMHADEVLERLAAGAWVLVDGLAVGALASVLTRHAARLKLLILLHMPLAAERGLDYESSRHLQLAEDRALRCAHHIIVTAGYTRQHLCEQGLDPERISVVEPGTDAVPLAKKHRGPCLRLLCVATLHAGKGHDLLFEALAALRELPWQLTCVGSVVRSPVTAARLKHQLRRLGLHERVTLVGEVPHETVSRFYLEADLFVLATRFETYGMAIAEALAHGLPVISTCTGAIPTLVGEDAGLLVGAGDLGELRHALARVLTDQALYAKLLRGAAAAGIRLPRWPQQAARLGRVLERLGMYS